MLWRRWYGFWRPRLRRGCERLEACNGKLEREVGLGGFAVATLRRWRDFGRGVVVTYWEDSSFARGGKIPIGSADSTHRDRGMGGHGFREGAWARTVIFCSTHSLLHEMTPCYESHLYSVWLLARDVLSRSCKAGLV